MATGDYLGNVQKDSLDPIIKRRREAIEKAPSTMPRYEYNANVVAAKLHPSVQHVIVSKIDELPGAKCYTLVPDKDAGTEHLAYFRAGQYISLHLKIGDSVLTRPYSLCSSPSQALKDEYQILVKSMKNGFASEYINTHFEVGTILDISAPSGFFEYEPLRDGKSVTGIAGGSGIAPFMSFARAIADGTEDFELTLLYGSRTEDEILFKDELEEIAKKTDKVKVVHVLSDEEKEGYEKGFITSDLIASKSASDGYSVFVCGSQGMYDYIEGEASKLGIRKKFLRLDAYGEYRLTKRDSEFTEQFGDKTFNITVVSSDGTTREIPAKANETVLVALERAGIKAPSKCRSGECGFCRSKLASGEVYTPERVERRRLYDKESGYIHPCSSFPKSDLKILIDCIEPKVRRTVKDMAKKEKMMGLVMTIIISIAMGALASFLVLKTQPQAAKGTPVPMLYISNILMSVLVGLIVYRFVPLGKMGRGLAAKFGANPPGTKFDLLNAIPLSVGNTLIISIVVSLFGVLMGRAKAPAGAELPPFITMWLGSWATLLLPTLIVSYLLAVLLSPIVSDLIGLSGAGAEIGRAAASDD